MGGWRIGAGGRGKAEDERDLLAVNLDSFDQSPDQVTLGRLVGVIEIPTHRCRELIQRGHDQPAIFDMPEPKAETVRPACSTT